MPATMDRSPSPPLPPDPIPRSKGLQQATKEGSITSLSQQSQPDQMLQQQQQQQQQHAPPVQPPQPQQPSAPPRSRATSRPPIILHQPQPVREAVHDAFDHSSVAQKKLDPELVRQVTEEVIRNLQLQQAKSAATPTASMQPERPEYAAPPPPPPPPPPPQQSDLAARSPTQGSQEGVPQRRVTPPSPDGRRTREAGVFAGSPSPERKVPSDAGSTYSRESMRSGMGSMHSGRDYAKDEYGVRRSDTTSSRRSFEASTDDGGRRRRGSGSSTTTTGQARGGYRRDSRGSESDHNDSVRSRVRPARVPSDVPETTTLERAWQPLFESGKPLARLGQFLRGLALHLIDDYEPKCTLVVTPQKMLRFFNETKLADERYPWETIFGGAVNPRSLSKIYSTLHCSHHYVQTQDNAEPTIPALTPDGFSHFTTLLIQAHPDLEFDRLAKAVMNMPISNADNKTERFPKELSRRLLPAQGNMLIEQKIVAALMADPAVGPLKGAVNLPGPPAAAPPQQSSFMERERKPYSQTPASNAVDDDDLSIPSVPLERERKPYTAKEGTGKKYGNENEREQRQPSTPYRPSADAAPSPHQAQPNVRSSRSNSGLPTQQAPYATSNGTNLGTSEPTNIPPPRSHRMSQDRGPPPAMLNNNAMSNLMNGNSNVPKGRRTPPPRNIFTRSEPMDINGIPSSQHTSNLNPYPGSGYRDRGRDRDREYVSDYSDPEDRGGHSSRRHHSRRRTRERSSTAGGAGAEEEGVRGYPIPPRPPPSAQQGFGALGGEYGGSVGSQPRSLGAGEGRRQTWYGVTGNTGAGSDGYGSFAGGTNSNAAGYVPPPPPPPPSQQQQGQGGHGLYGSSVQGPQSQMGQY